MDERATFETRAVLVPKHARISRLAVLLPAVALTITAWAGLNGARPHDASREASQPAALAEPPAVASEPAASAAAATPPPERPAQVFGLDVQRLDAMHLAGLSGDDIVVLTGWYAPTAITDCPRLAAIYRDGALPDVRGDIDPLAFCVRSGLFYASRPDVREYRFNGARRLSIPATFVIGVIAPMGIETVGADPTEVVVIARFVESSDGCSSPAGCGHELLIDHVAWSGGA